MATKLRIQGQTPEAFAAGFGGDPCYMRAPNEPGDGYLFYNFSSVPRTPEWCARFVAAIDRTIKAFTGTKNKANRAGLRKLRSYVAALGAPMSQFCLAYIEASRKKREKRDEQKEDRND